MLESKEPRQARVQSHVKLATHCARRRAHLPCAGFSTCACMFSSAAVAAGGVLCPHTQTGRERPERVPTTANGTSLSRKARWNAAGKSSSSGQPFPSCGTLHSQWTTQAIRGGISAGAHTKTTSWRTNAWCVEVKQRPQITRTRPLTQHDAPETESAQESSTLGQGLKAMLARRGHELFRDSLAATLS
jgi:hypothetical protein